MIVSKNRKGSLLIEAVFALCIAATLLVPLFSSLATLIQHIGFNNQKIDAFFNAKHFLQTVEYQKNVSVQSDQKETPQKTQTQKLENGSILTYSEQPIHKKSIFNNPYLAHVTVSYTWQSAFKDGVDTLTTYIVQIPKEKE